jgi:hypothetical protein
MNPQTLFSPGRPCWLGLAALVFASPAFADNGTAPAPGDKSYVLFMGADFDLQQGRGQPLHRVRDMARGSFVIYVDGREVLVPVGDSAATAIKISKSLKLADRFVQATGFKAERVYSATRNPFRSLANSAGNVAAVEAMSEQNIQRVAALQAAAPPVGGSTGGDGPGVEPPPPQSALQLDAIRRLNDANMALNSNMNDIGRHADRMAAEAGKQEYDAVEVALRLSSVRPLSGAYLVAVVQYRAPGAKPSEVNNWIHAEELPLLDQEPRTITIRQGGFPPGYEIVRSEVHLYEAGREIGTNVADRSMQLTREEAHQYLVVEHLASHKGETLPPSVALGLAAEDVSPLLDPAGKADVIYVKVNAEGVPIGAYRDAELIRPAGAAIEHLVAVARFMPALRKGRAVDGIARLTLADLVQAD